MGTVSGWRRWVYLCLGFGFVGLAALGVFLPVLPTTPFLLLACFCFVRSSPAMNRWLLRSRLFGPLLRDWQKHRAIRPRAKFTAVAFIVVAVAASIWLGNLSVPLSGAVAGLAMIGMIVVLRLPTLRTEPSEQGTSAP